jgi:hypothetical protein
LGPADAAFQNTGLERSQALADDLAYFKEKYGLTPKPAGADSPGRVREMATINMSVLATIGKHP